MKRGYFTRFLAIGELHEFGRLVENVALHVAVVVVVVIIIIDGGGVGVQVNVRSRLRRYGD